MVFRHPQCLLNPGAFNSILDKIGGFETLNFEFKNTDLESKVNISELENRYAEAVPEVKERVSKYIERGTIAQQYKRKQVSNARFVMF